MAAIKDERWSLAGKTALVTGGSRGIGKGIVEELAKFGAIVHTCDKAEEYLNNSLQEWKEKNFNITGSVCDVSMGAERENLMKEVHSLFDGKLNILVNNVGISIVKPATEFSADDVSQLMSTNFESGFHLSQLAHPLLRDSGNGTVIFISSMSSLIAFPRTSLYACSKGAINSLTRSLAVEWAEDNIRVNSVAPGVTKTPAAQLLIEKTEFSTKELACIPTGRFAEPEEIGSVVTFLCMAASSYVNGQVISVDAGRSINGTGRSTNTAPT